MLHLDHLTPGDYRFKLTVVDSDGVSNSTSATVKVNKVTFNLIFIRERSILGLCILNRVQILTENSLTFINLILILKNYSRR